MSVQAMTAVFKQSKMGGTTRLVLLALANYYGDHGAWPSIDSLAADCQMSRRAIQDCLHRAAAAGELHIEANAGVHGTNRYWLHIQEGGCRFCTRADHRRESAPEPLGTDSSLEVSNESSKDLSAIDAENPVDNSALKADNRPTPDQMYLAEKLADGDPALSPAAIQKLNGRFGRAAVTDAMRELRGFPPTERIRSAYAYLAVICEGREWPGGASPAPHPSEHVKIRPGPSCDCGSPAVVDGLCSVCALDVGSPV